MWFAEVLHIYFHTQADVYIKTYFNQQSKLLCIYVMHVMAIQKRNW